MLGGRHGTLFIFFFFFSQTPKPATGGGADVGQVDTGCQRRNLGPNLGRQKLRRLGRGPGSSAEQPLVNPASSAGAERLTVEGRKTGWLSVRLSVRPFVRQQRQPQRKIHTVFLPHSKGKPPYFFFSLPAEGMGHATHMGKIRQEAATGSAEALPQITPAVLNHFLTAFGWAAGHFQQVRNTSPP